MPHHQVASLHIGCATADTSDVIFLNVAALQRAECSLPTTGRPRAVCEQSARVCVWSASHPSSQPHSYGVNCLIGDGPISGGQDITTIAIFDDSLQAELWSDVLDVIPMRPASDDRNPTADEIAGAVRDAERFLDLIGMLASSRSAFLFDYN